AAPLIIDGLRMIASGRFSLTEQDEAKVTMAPKLTKTDGAIDWGRDALKVRDQIRGLAGWPGSYSRFKGKLIKIFPPVSADQEAAKASPGTVIAVSKSALRVACGSGHLEITDLQPEGKRRMSVREFEAGHGIKEGDKFLH
ncbi:MAG: methionyl-tRNA formyltransferase, partial [Deltaproteobacteria bacterium]